MTIADESDQVAEAKERGRKLIKLCMDYIHEGVRIRVREHDKFLGRAEKFQQQVKLLLEE